MSSLMIKLRSEEKLFINGAVLQNCSNRTTLKICSENARILRMREALHPDEAVTPVKRAYYLAQLGVTGTVCEAELQPQLREMLFQLIHVFRAFPNGSLLAEAVELLERKKYYKIMKLLGDFFELEKDLLQRNQMPSVQFEPLGQYAV